MPQFDLCVEFDIVRKGMTRTATLTATTSSATRTNGIVGLTALSFVLFLKALSELNQVGGELAHLTTLSGLLVTVVLAWRIQRPD